MKRLSELGANHVIHPELEGGLEIVRHTLLTLGYPMTQIQPYVDTVRHDAYAGAFPGDKPLPMLDQFLTAVRSVTIAWEPVDADSPVVQRSLAEANIRSRVGASVIAVIREQEMIPNPKSSFQFQVGDLLGLIGSPQELAAAKRWLNNELEAAPAPQQRHFLDELPV